MPLKDVVRARIDHDIKEEAASVLEAMGLTVSDAFRMMMKRIAQEKKLPFDLPVPNPETIAAIKAGREGQVSRFDSVDDLMADLNADD